jgi:site-specific recombinase XerD
VIEKKTGKIRRIPLEPVVLKRVSDAHSLMSITDNNQKVFLNPETGNPYTSQHINKQLKNFRVRYRLPIKNISSHTFRKTFGRHIYESNGRTEHSILMVNRALRHQDIATTILYLGIRQEEFDEVYKQAIMF